MFIDLAVRQLAGFAGFIIDSCKSCSVEHETSHDIDPNEKHDKESRRSKERLHWCGSKMKRYELATKEQQESRHRCPKETSTKGRSALYEYSIRKSEE